MRECERHQEPTAPAKPVVWGLCCALLAILLLGTLRADDAENRHAAIQRGLDYLNRLAADDRNFDDFSSDLLWCFYFIAQTDRDPAMRALGMRTARQMAERWRERHRHVPPNAEPFDLQQLAMAAYVADRLGRRDPAFKNELRRAARRFSAIDNYGFDPEREPPPYSRTDRYALWLDALIRSYAGEIYGMRLGAGYASVVKWAPCMRPYEGHDDDTEFDAFYSVTHFVYTLDHYNQQTVAPLLLPDEIAFVRRKLRQAIDEGDPEMVGEALDTLKHVGAENDPLVPEGMRYLVSTQRADGAWADEDDDLYTHFHSVWTSIDGLRDYRQGGRVRRLPRLVSPSRCRTFASR
jgi:hypothetical protein